MANNNDLIKSVLEEMFSVMGFSEVEMEIKEGSETTTINILTPEAGFLIGVKGENLLALQSLMRIIVNKRCDKSELPKPFVLDINNYRSNRARLVEELARNMADEACLGMREVVLQPMPSFERRIVHAVLSERINVMTESIGHGETRRVVIRPVC